MRHLAAAFLPQRGTDASAPAPARPVSAKLVRRVRVRDGGGVQYQFHVAFAMPAPPPDGLEDATRPLLAINRGLHHLYAAVVTPPDAARVLEAFAASGAELGAVQAAMERRRAERQRAGEAPMTHTRGARDRRQARIAAHHLALCANAIVAAATRHRAQVVLEDLTSFAPGHALRSLDAKPAARRAGLRQMLNRRQFQRLAQLVDQRLEVAGLPLVRTVSGSYISQTCPACGHRDAANRAEGTDGGGANGAPQWRVFRCVRCGADGDVDTVAAANVARKLVWLRLRGVEKKAGVAESERTSWDAWAHAHPVVLPAAILTGGG